MMNISTRNGFLAILVTVLVLGLAVDAGFAQDDDSDKKKKKKKKKKKSAKATTEQSISPEMKKTLNKVERELLAYDAAGARQLLQPYSDKKEPLADAAMGRVLILEQNYNQAASTLERASSKTDDLYPLIYLGEAYSYAKQEGQAKQAFRKAADKAKVKLTKSPNDADALYCLGVAQQRLDQYDQALESLQKAKSVNSKNELIPYQLGLTHILRRDYQAAFDNLDKAVGMNSGFAYAYYYRGLAADKIGRKDILVNDMDRFLALAPDAPEADKARKILQAARG